MKVKFSLVNKYVIATGVVALLSSSSFAADFYGGLEGGVEFLNVNKTGSATVVNTQPALVSTAKTASNGINGAGTVYLGLGQRAGHFYFGSEIAASYLGANTTVTYNDKNYGGSGGTVHEQVNYSFSASILPGFYVSSNNKVFLRAGMIYGNITSKMSSSYASRYMNNLAYTGNFTENDFGYIVGIGLQSLFSNHWSLRCEYNFSAYNSFSKNDNVVTLQGGAQRSVDMNYHPMVNQVLLGLTFHFGTA